MNIAICDDNGFMADKLEALVRSCFSDRGECFCSVFYSGEELLESLQEEATVYQIYLLDIEMGQIDGLETAARIRDADRDAVIIFVTSHGELMPEAFQVLAFQFIVKPFDENKARQIFLKAVHAVKEKRTCFHFVIRKKTYTLYLKDIVCFESFNRKVIIHTVSDEEYEYYGSLKDVLRELGSLSFAQVHNSYLVNMEHIKTMGGEGLLMDNGLQIAVTKSYGKTFHEAYKNFVLVRMK